MRYGVVTDEMSAAVVRLREGARLAAEHRSALDARAAGADSWCAGRAAEAANAFFATLAQAALGAAEGLDELAGRVEAAAGAYDAVEAAAPPTS
ncbi:hypothetical protein MO973_40600 [Paenibacillus sp. TRM 82003]|uniref:hypothetical protein n=1 Tax=Kineococcus sp. TRM81007 TaxID=2925831 RepID=UPI001F587E43|nr:hypothetical protein [Kineococcus sp. TRM81007]MCI2237032.1 hypothetical protein [Kineococcus sp. TRM81007]MCI3926501.1 hypothetical protein [Paenibacillus sp. TRM 82003]